jgi:hypothetical protein
MDKGFFSRDLLEGIEDKGAYYVTPLPASCNIYTSKHSKTNISLALSITKSLNKKGYFDEILFLCESKKPVRFIAYQLAEKSAQKRLKQYLKQCRKHRRQPTDEGLARQGIMILITNDLSIDPEVVSCLYSMRWQIELIFKTWKSQMKMDDCLGTNPNRILVLVYSRLIATTILSLILSPIIFILEMYYDKEVSLWKVVNWLAQIDRAFKILRGDLSTLESLFYAAEKWLYKEDNRRRKTTRQRLTELAHVEFAYAI